METEFIIAGILIFLSFVLGWIMMDRKAKNKTTQDMTNIPFVGPMVNIQAWKPKDKKGWSRIINNILLAAYSAVAVYFSFFWIFVIWLIIYDYDWAER